MSDQLAEYFKFLDDLRESGATNMYGAASYLEDEFALDRKEAGKILLKWMRSFDRDKTAAARAAYTE